MEKNRFYIIIFHFHYGVDLHFYVRFILFSPLGKVAGRAIYFTDVFSLFYFFSGRPWSHAGSEANGPIFTKISGMVDN